MPKSMNYVNAFLRSWVINLIYQHTMGDRNMPQRYLLIGGAGLVGATLAGRLVKSGQTVVCVDSFRAARAIPQWRRPAYDWRLAQANGADLVELDIRDHRRVRDLISAWQPEVVYFLAALLAAESSADPQEAEDVQVHAFQNVLAAIDQLSTPVHLVLASSSYVYGNFENLTADESATRSPVDVYGRTKVIAEDILTGCPPSHMTYTILRPASVYGVGDPRKRFATTAIEESVRFGHTQVKYADLTADFTHVDDVALAFEMAANRDYHRLVFNVTRGETHTYTDLVEYIRQMEDCVDITVEGNAIPETVPRRGEIDCTLARETIGWTAAIGLEEGVKLEILNARAIYSAESPRVQTPEEFIRRSVGDGSAMSGSHV